MCHVMESGSNKQMELYGGAGMAQPVQNTRDSVEHVFGEQHRCADGLGARRVVSSSLGVVKTVPR